jgi:iron complex outermembrane receptor protein
MSKLKFLRSVSPFAIAGSLLAVGSAVAQVAQPAANQVVASAGEPQVVASVDQASGDFGGAGDGLQEIVVTAQKRSEKAQNVPIALTVIGKGELQERPQIKSTQDIILFIPSAQGPTTEGHSRPRYFVRGIGTNNINFNAISPLGTYYDDIYISNVYDQALPLYDLDHVEALSGPQGTLWGKNANAGAINFISKAPSFAKEPEGYATLGGGSFGEIRAEGALSGALVDDKVAGRLSFFHDSSDGWQHNLYDGRQYGGGSDDAGRAQLLVQPSDDLSALVNFHFRRYNGDGRAAGFINDPLDGFNRNTFTPYYKGVRQPATAYDQVNVAGPNGDHIDEKGGAVKVNWDQPDFSVTSISGYERNDRDSNTGATGGVAVPGIVAPPAALNPALVQFWGPAPQNSIPSSAVTTNTSFWQVSEELRIASPTNQRFTWLAGLYGFWEQQNTITQTAVLAPNVGAIGTAAAATSGAFGQTPASPQLSIFPWKQNTFSYAGFGNIGYEVTDDLKISTGVRWSAEHTSINSSFSDLPGANQAALNANPALLNVINLSNYTNVATRQVAAFGDSQTHRAWTYDFSPEYRITNDIHVYFRYAHGVLPANYSFQPLLNAAGQSLGTFKPLQLHQETLDAYEIGLKTQWFEHRLTLNGSLFHYDYDNAAINVPTVVPGLTVPAVLFRNAGGEVVDGGDLSFNARVTPQLNVGGNVGLLRTVYLDDAVNKSAGVVGQQAPRSPHLTLSAYASYDQSLGDFGNLVFAADTNFKTTTYFYPTATTQSVANAAGFIDRQKQGPYTLVNANITWYPVAGGNTSFQFSVLNLLDRQYVDLTLQNGFGANAVYNGQPRSFLFQATYKFGEADEAPVETASTYTPPRVVAPAQAPRSYLVFFDFNKSDLTQEAVQIVDQAANNAGAAKVTRLTVTGHTDTVGSDAYNLRLSRRRAETVAAALEAKGIPSAEIEIIAKGKHDLLVPTADGVKEPQNRRVQIVYVDGASA